MPDELIQNEISQNGTNDQHHNQDSTTQKHQQLSQLLSNTPPSSSGSPLQNVAQSRSPNVGGLNVNNVVKSPPLTNNLASPPHGPVKTGTPHIGDQNFSTSSAAYTMSNNAGLVSVSNAVMKPMGQHINTSNIGLSMGQHSELLNGPLNATSGSMPSGIGQTVPNMSQAAIMGNMNSQQMSGHSLGHMGLNAQNQQSMMKVRRLCCSCQYHLCIAIFHSFYS